MDTIIVRLGIFFMFLGFIIAWTGFNRFFAQFRVIVQKLQILNQNSQTEVNLVDTLNYQLLINQRLVFVGGIIFLFGLMGLGFGLVYPL